MTRDALDTERWVLDQLPHTCAGPNDCHACRTEEQLAESAPDESCRHYGAPDCEWCQRHADDRGDSPQDVTYQEAIAEGSDPYEPDFDPR